MWASRTLGMTPQANSYLHLGFSYLPTRVEFIKIQLLKITNSIIDHKYIEINLWAFSLSYLDRII